MRRSGISSLFALILLASACVPKYGFSGGGLPSHIRTMAIQPFDNETPTPELQRELLDAMRRELQSRLGVRDAPEERSDAVVRGVIRTYDADVPVAYSANPAQAVTARRRLRITLDVQIVDLTNNRTIWEKQGAQRGRRVCRAGRGRRTARGAQTNRERHRRRSAVSMVRPRTGSSTLGCLFVLMLLSAAGYFAVNVGEVYFRYYQVQGRDAAGGALRGA